MNDLEMQLVPGSNPLRVARTHSTQRDNVRGKHSDHFQTPNLGLEGKGAWFATAWFCWRFGLPSDLYFYEES